jgi:hypothetical protein
MFFMVVLASTDRSGNQFDGRGQRDRVVERAVKRAAHGVDAVDAVCVIVSHNTRVVMVYQVNLNKPCF